MDYLSLSFHQLWIWFRALAVIHGSHSSNAFKDIVEVFRVPETGFLADLKYLFIGTAQQRASFFYTFVIQIGR